jgi:hypothetical protein
MIDRALILNAKLASHPGRVVATPFVSLVRTDTFCAAKKRKRRKRREESFKGPAVPTAEDSEYAEVKWIELKSAVAHEMDLAFAAIHSLSAYSAKV